LSGSKMADKIRLSKRQLEILLGKVKILEKPSLKLEQYPVSSEAASELLYMAGFEHNDLEGRVIDLGAGTGRLAIGAVLMGAKEVVGIDIDDQALAIAEANADAAGVQVEWVQSDIEKVDGRFVAVIMNPPYGTRTSHADTQFLEKAFQLAPVVYSIHKSSTREFLFEFVTRSGWQVDQVRSMRMEIPHLFEFHEKKRATVEVDLYRIVWKAPKGNWTQRSPRARTNQQLAASGQQAHLKPILGLVVPCGTPYNRHRIGNLSTVMLILASGDDNPAVQPSIVQ
jgi:putative methylase